MWVDAFRIYKQALREQSANHHWPSLRQDWLQSPDGHAKRLGSWLCFMGPLGPFRAFKGLLRALEGPFFGAFVVFFPRRFAHSVSGDPPKDVEAQVVAPEGWQTLLQHLTGFL